MPAAPALCLQVPSPPREREFPGEIQPGGPSPARAAIVIAPPPIIHPLMLFLLAARTLR